MRLVTVEIKMARELVIYKLNAGDGESSESIKSRARRKLADKTGVGGRLVGSPQTKVEITNDVSVGIG